MTICRADGLMRLRSGSEQERMPKLSAGDPEDPVVNGGRVTYQGRDQ